VLEWAERRGHRPQVARTLSLLGLLALSESDSATAAHELRAAAALVHTMGIANPANIPALPDAIEAVASIGDLDEAQSLLERLERQTESLDNAFARALCARSRGLVLLARGRPDAAVPDLESAVATFERQGFGPEVARGELALGRALLRRGRRSKAAEVLAVARDRFAVMGARLWEARAAEELERAGPGRAKGDFTRAERSVARLVAQGAKNREIGQTLFMSTATVEAHLTRIYRKLDIRSRSELTRLVAAGDVSLADEDGAAPEG
jgi:ATP/maltotriose-dependent transcriptional regulator MalT